MYNKFKMSGKILILKKRLSDGCNMAKSKNSSVSPEAEARFNELVKGHEKLLLAIGKL